MKTYNGAGILLFRYGEKGFEVLLGKRTNKPEVGKWSIPGGGLEKTDKSFMECAEREFKEETGVDFNSFERRYCSYIKIYIPYFKWQTFFVMTKGLFQDLNPSWEFSEVKWVPIEDVEEHECGMALGLEIRRLKAYIKKHQIEIADYTDMPFKDQKLLQVYRIKKQSRGELTATKLQREMNISFSESEDLIRRLENEK